MSKFQLLNHESTQEIVEHTFTLQDEHGKIIYKEWTSGGKVIDLSMRDKDGNEIDDVILLEQVQEFVDGLQIII